MTDHHALVAAFFGALLALSIVRMLQRWQRDEKNPFDVKDLFLENGRASRGAVLMIGAFVATTWFFVYYTLAGKMTEAYFLAYIGAWITPIVARMFATSPQAPQVPPQ